MSRLVDEVRQMYMDYELAKTVLRVLAKRQAADEAQKLPAASR